MYVGRKNGEIYGTWTCRQPEDADHSNIEEVPDDHPDVVAFKNRSMPNRTAILAAAIDAASNLQELKTAVKQALNI